MDIRAKGLTDRLLALREEHRSKQQQRLAALDYKTIEDKRKMVERKRLERELKKQQKQLAKTLHPEGKYTQGYIWITDGFHNTKIPGYAPIPVGFTAGRTYKRTKNPSRSVQPRYFKRGSRFYNNGVSNIVLEREINPPAGYVLGKLPNERKEFHWYTNGTKDIYIGPDDAIPEGYRRGMVGYIKPPNHLGFKCYTDGTRTIKLREGDQIPDGFKLGSTKRKRRTP